MYLQQQGIKFRERSQNIKYMLSQVHAGGPKSQRAITRSPGTNVQCAIPRQLQKVQRAITRWSENPISSVQLHAENFVVPKHH